MRLGHNVSSSASRPVVCGPLVVSGHLVWCSASKA